MLFRILTSLAIFLIGLSTLNAQEVTNSARALNEIRAEIAQFRTMIAEAESKEQSHLDKIKVIDQKIALSERYLSELKSAERELSRTIASNSEESGQLSSELEKLRGLYKIRAVNLYKQGKANFLSYIFEAESASQIAAIKKYYEILSDRDRKKVEQIVSLLSEIDERNSALAVDLDQKNRLRATTQKEKMLLDSNKVERKTLLISARADKNRIQNELRSKQDAEKEILAIIARMTGINSKVDPALFEGFENFASSKGRMPWPISGTVISHVGMVVDPKTKTKTMNRGIDIVAAGQSPVKAVCGGRVANVKWLPWYGQTVFVQHKDHYYSVYSSLSKIDVASGDVVESGSLIGGTGSGKLHFQIWKDGKHLDPETWLSNNAVAFGVKTARKKK